MDKLTIATKVLLKLIETDKTGFDAEGIAAYSFEIADAMQAEAEKRKKAEAEQKRKEIREMLNATNTFVEREGQHFDDVEEAKREGEYFFKLFCRQNGIDDSEALCKVERPHGF